MRAKALLGTALLLSAVMAGCASSPAPETEAPELGSNGLTDIFERVRLPFNVTGDYSHTLLGGVFEVLEPVSVYVDVALPPTEGGAATDPTDPPVAHLGIFLPDIPGCDFSSVPKSIGARGGVPSVVGQVAGPAVGQPRDPGHDHNGSADCHVPVIADAGPYWGESDVAADARGSGRLGEFLIENFVPHGYAVAQISVMGSGKSNHCFDMFGLAEQLGVHQAVEWLGAQEWSNGNVGLIGRSYDGSTPWMAAAHASPGSALKTIVPISGLSGLQDLVTWNGASESRILTFHNVIYGQFGVGGDDVASDVRHRATCPDWVTATPMGAVAYAKGDDVAQGTYWHERNFVPRVLDNYEGSVYMIHGLLDNNVDPHAGWVAHQAMIDKGLETKGLYGQWFHSYPDRPGEHGQEPYSSVRYDWAQDLLEWFDHYLKGTGPQPPLWIEVQEQEGRWRIDDGLMPSTATIIDVPLGMGEIRVGPTEEEATLDLGVVGDQDTVLGGLSSITFSVTPTGPGGQIYFDLIDFTEGQTFGLSYGIAELRHAPGGGETPPVPGVAMQVEIPAQYFSAVLEAGHHIGLRIAGTGNGYLPSPVVQPVIVDLAGSTLHLSTVDPGPEQYFEPPLWEPEEE